MATHRGAPMEGEVEYKAINFEPKFAVFDERWQPKVVAEMNDYQFKIVKLKGDFIWHDHKETDDFRDPDGNLIEVSEYR